MVQFSGELGGGRDGTRWLMVVVAAGVVVRCRFVWRWRWWSDTKMIKMVQVRERCRCEDSPARRKMVELWWPEVAAAAVEGGHGG